MSKDEMKKLLAQKINELVRNVDSRGALKKAPNSYIPLIKAEQKTPVNTLILHGDGAEVSSALGVVQDFIGTHHPRYIATDQPGVVAVKLYKVDPTALFECRDMVKGAEGAKSLFRQPILHYKNLEGFSSEIFYLGKKQDDSVH